MYVNTKELINTFFNFNLPETLVTHVTNFQIVENISTLN